MLNKDQNEPGAEELEVNDMLLFVSGEMDPDKQSRFEQRLIDEPQLALALSEVIEVEAVLGASEPQAPGTSQPQSAVDQDRLAAQPHELPTLVHLGARRPQVRSEQSRSALPVLAAIAACVLVAVVVAPKAMETRSVPVVVNDPVVTEQPAEFLDQWLDTIVASELDLVEAEEEAVELAMLDPIDALQSETGDVVPGWMYVAFEEDESAGVSVE